MPADTPSCQPMAQRNSEVRDADRMKHDDMLGQVQLEKLGAGCHGSFLHIQPHDFELF